MRAAMLATVVCFSIVGASVGQNATAAIKVPTNIPAQPLGRALKDFAESRNLQVLYFSKTVGRKRTGGASGALTADEALTQLLSGTGLTYQYVNDKAITIIPLAVSGSAGAASGDSLQTPSVRAGESDSASSFRLAQAGQGTTVPSPSPPERTPGRQQSVATDEMAEVVVTSEKRAERLLDVPISESVLGGESLEQPDVQGAADALSRVPGLSVNVASLGGATQLTMRGVSTGSAQWSGAGTVGYYIDGVPFGLIRSAAVPDASPYDLQRIEVLRGPQGTLYGASALNGVVRILTNEPNFTSFDVKARTTESVTDGSGGINYREDAAVNVPLVQDVLAARAVVSYTKLNGWIDTPSAADINDTLQKSFRLKLAARPTDDLTVTLSGWLWRDSHGSRDYADSNNYVNYAAHEPLSNDYDTYNIRLEYELANVSISSDSSYLYYHNPSDYDIGAPGPLAVLETNEHSHIYSEELLFRSKNQEPWRWSLGGFYRYAEDDTIQSGSDVLPIPEAWNDYSRSAALFGEVARRFLDNTMEVSAGLRYFEDRVRMQETVDYFQTGSLVDTEHTYVAFTPRVVLSVFPAKDVTAYASYSEGFRSGFPQLFTILTYVPGFPDVKPDRLKNYEAGVKSDLFDRKLSLEAAVYYIKWTNVQEKLQVEEGGLYYNAPLNAAAASGPGADLSITLRPSRAFSVGASLSVNNLEFDKDVVSGEHDVIAYREGNRLNLSPKWTASTFGDYHFALGAGLTGTLSASVSYVSSQYSSNLNAAQTAVVVATGTSRVLGQTSFAVNSGEHWRATLFANNVTNTNPVVEIDPNAQLGVRIRPRTIGLQIDYHK
ncbi:MAG TPA: TonB-dependent receptor [Steroidobacteraceae bacterium]|nr:TonB-dependent receptor [Steroidobacteraceae bacterium]